MTSGAAYEPSESFVRLGPVDQSRMRDELWTMWERLTSEHHTSVGPRWASAERETLLVLSDAIRQAHQLSHIVSQLRRESRPPYADSAAWEGDDSA